ncbi:hypothetical protein [Actinomadura rubrisoli]|uniref:hypothetical protein n=1 Tax=Actinomadura rubrisoli TaxID=2530368 RepID=UPI001404E8EA|nr:hypothetical protein [Actinomadura rubrisoli]
MSVTLPSAQPAAAPGVFAGLFAEPETLVAVHAQDYTKKDGDSDQPSKYDEI